MLARTISAEYTKSHPWIKFELELRNAPARLWLALGEARSKCEHLAGVPLQPELARTLHTVYLAKGVHATAAIEGNTLKERDVMAKIEGKLDVPESQEYLEKEIENILKAVAEVESVVETKGQNKITPTQIRQINKLILDGLELDDHVVPGDYTKCTVGVMNYRGAPWEECPHLMDRLCEWLNTDFEPKDDDEIIMGVIKSIVAHVYIAWIHPFGDGNGRTARIMEVRFLMESGVPSSAIHLLSNHYNKTRSEYYKKLSEASQNGGDLTEFILYAVRGFVDQLRDQLKVVKGQQWIIAWQNFIYEIFGEEKTVADKRQIRLLLDLSMTNEFVSRRKLRELTPKLATLYAGKTAKTLTRDLNSLEEKGLIQRSKDGVRARREIILAFLPRAKKGQLESHIVEVFSAEHDLPEDIGALQLDLLSLLD